MRQRIRSFGKAIIKRLVSSGIGRAQILCLLAGSFLSAAYIFAGAQGSFLRDGRYILRGSYGEGEEEYELKVSGLGDEEEMISLTVSERKYTDQELQVLFSELAEQLPVIMAGDNKDLDNVDRDLYLPDSVDGFEGIRLSWYPEDLDLISYKGELKAEITGPEETGLSLVMKGGDISEEYFYRIRLIPAVYTEDEQLRRELISSIEEADKRNREGEFLELPTEVSGRKVSYSPAGDMTPVLIMTLSITAALLLWLRPAEEERKKQRERKESLRRDYPELVTRLLLYIGAGLTIKNAWISICGDMEEIDGDGLTRPLTGELRRTVNDMEKGAPESRAYPEFGRRCGLRCYQRLAAILEQGRKNGDRNLRERLRFEMDEAYEERKNRALRTGQEASTRLMLPLFISFAAIMLIVMAPSLISLM